MTECCPLFIFAPGALAGAERVVLSGLRALVSKGIGAEIILVKELRSPNHVEQFVEILNPQVKVHIVETQSPFDLSMIKECKKIISQLANKKVILHSHGYKALFLASIVKNQFPLVHTHHGDTSHTFKVKMYEKLAYFLMRKSQLVFAVSKPMNEQLHHRGIKSTKIINNMISLENISSLSDQKKKQEKENTKINLLFLGRLSPEKGILFILDCLSKVETLEKFHLHVVGDGSERALAEQLTRKLNLEKNVSFYGFQNKPISYLLKADVLVMPSLREGMPMTLLEALALGIPVLANDVGALSSLIQHGLNGKLLKVEDLISWTEALNSLDKDLDTMTQFTQSQADQIQNNFSAEAWADQTITSYQLFLS